MHDEDVDDDDDEDEDEDVDAESKGEDNKEGEGDEDRFPPRPQMYESTIYDDESDTTVFFCTVPSRSVPETLAGLKAPEIPRTMARQLGLGGWARIDPDELPLAMEMLVADVILHSIRLSVTSWLPAYEAPREGIYSLRTFLSIDPTVLRMFTPSKTQFARYLTQESVVPFENSPLHSLSLAEITKASGSALGAYVGFTIAGSGSPLLLITVPAGMVICGVASGAAHGLEEAIRKQIVSMLSERRPRKKSDRQ